MNDQLKTELKTDFHKTITSFKKSSPGQKFSVVSLFMLALSLPLGIMLSLKPIKPIITPATVFPPTNTPTPTPSPIIGNEPVLVTSFFQDAYLGKNFTTKVEGYDLDLNDKLTLTASNLPDGIVLKNCSTLFKRVNSVDRKINYISCTISGKATQAGIFEVVFKLNDTHNNVFKYIKLTVNK